MNKRPATSDETKTALIDNMDCWNLRNPNFQHPLSYWEEKQVEAEKEGYISEVCGQCGSVFLAFHHMTTCRENGCPMSCGQTALEIMESKLNET